MTTEKLLKMNPISRLGLLFSVIWILAFVARYIVILTDYSEALLFIGLGVCFFSTSYLYHLYRKEVKRREHTDAILDQVEIYIKDNITKKEEVIA